jgi:hypothetical protein
MKTLGEVDSDLRQLIDRWGYIITKLDLGLEPKNLFSEVAEPRRTELLIEHSNQCDYDHKGT